MVEKKVVGEGRLPPWEIAQPHPGRRETHHNQGRKLQFLSKSESDKEEPNISGKQFWFAFSQPLRRVRAPLGAVLVTVTLSLVPKQIKMAIILPTGQWYAPSAVLNDAWYCMVLHGIAFYCMVLHSIAWNCMVLQGIAWNCMVLHGNA